MVTVINLPRSTAGGHERDLRGIAPAGIQMRDLKLQDGRWFNPGQREIVVGKSSPSAIRSAPQ